MVYALAPFVMYFAHEAGLPFLPAILLALIAAAIVGMINGFITVVLQIPSFITTLGTLFVIKRSGQASSDTRRVYPVFAVLYPVLGVQFVINHHSVMALDAVRGSYLVKIRVRLNNHWEATHTHNR